jgi:hypothetical protein
MKDDAVEVKTEGIPLTRRSIGSRIGRFAITGMLLGSALACALQARRARPQGVYSCCGNVDCTIVTRAHACPGGNNQCSSQQTYIYCCTNACNST